MQAGHTTERLTASDGIAIAVHRFEPDEPSTRLPPVVLHHGFAADTTTNWVVPGVVDALLAAGRRVISVDARGHGASDTPHDPARYGEARMSRDLVEVLDALALHELDLVGYSMGAIVSVITASSDHRIRRLVIGGIGGRIARLDGRPEPSPDRRGIADALLTEEPEGITDPVGRAFRRFAESTGADRRALAAQMLAAHASPIALADITAPTLLIVGRDDALAADPEELAAAIPDCQLRIAPGDHLGIVAVPEFAPAVVGFLGQ